MPLSAQLRGSGRTIIGTPMGMPQKFPRIRPLVNGSSNSVLTGVTRDASGTALGGCQIELYHGKRLVAQTVSDGSGNYTFSNPGTGPFRIIATSSGFAGISTETLYPSLV